MCVTSNDPAPAHIPTGSIFVSTMTAGRLGAVPGSAHARHRDAKIPVFRKTLHTHRNRRRRVTNRSSVAVIRWIVALTIGWAALSAAQSPAVAPDASLLRPAGRWRDASIDEYRTHLIALEGLTQVCARERNLKTCDPTLVGPDDRVPLDAAGTASRRIIRYGWLRILFSHAEEPDKAESAPGSRVPAPPKTRSPRPAPPSTSQLLLDAEARLAKDLAQARSAISELPVHASERNTMNQVLAGREFHNLHQAGESDTALEKVGNWLNRLFARVDKLRSRSAWLGRALTWGFCLAVCIGLAWGLLQIEKRWRVRLVPMREAHAHESVANRDWQLWLADARVAAEAGHWREAIRFLYWASISRLESRRLWPADRARTPREYLALVDPEDPRMAGLKALTGRFESAWYGGRPAAERDYREAEKLASVLISAGPAGTLPPAAEGGNP